MTISFLGDLERRLRAGRSPELSDRDTEHASDREPVDRVAGRSEPQSSGPAFCGDIDLFIGRDGTWFYHGSPIGRKQLVRLFASILRRDENGDFWLETPAERCRIKVEDAPFLAVEINVNGSGETQDITFRTNIDEVVVAGPERPIRVATDSRSDAPAPYVLVRPGLEALITRAVYYELVELGCERHIEGETVLGVWSGGAFFPLGRL